MAKERDLAPSQNRIDTHPASPKVSQIHLIVKFLQNPPVSFQNLQVVVQVSSPSMRLNSTRACGFSSSCGSPGSLRRWNLLARLPLACVNLSIAVGSPTAISGTVLIWLLKMDTSHSTSSTIRLSKSARRANRTCEDLSKCSSRYSFLSPSSRLRASRSPNCERSVFTKS